MLSNEQIAENTLIDNYGLLQSLKIELNLLALEINLAKNELERKECTYKAIQVKIDDLKVRIITAL